MEGIKISVVIPAYNASATVVAAVGSVVQQTEKPYEIIVVDDASKDDTAEVVARTFGSAVKLLRMEKNGGPGAARNRGIALASGTHLAFQDADDVWHKEKLAHIRKVLEKAPHIRFLFHPYTLSPVDFAVKPEMLLPERYPFYKLLLSNPIGPQCVVMRREGTIAFDERLYHMEDYELFLKKAWEQGVYRIAAPFTQVGRPMLASGGLSGSRWKMRVGEMKAWGALAKAHPRFGVLLPFLGVFGLVKHVVKGVLPVRRNY